MDRSPRVWDRPLVRVLLALNLLVLLGLGVRAFINSRPAPDAGRAFIQERAKEWDKQGVLHEEDELRIREIARAVAKRLAVTDAEIEELLVLGGKSPSAEPALRDKATASALSALVSVKTFTPAQTRRLVPILRESTTDSEKSPFTASLAMSLGLKMRDPEMVKRVKGLRNSPNAFIRNAATILSARYEKKYGKG